MIGRVLRSQKLQGKSRPQPLIALKCAHVLFPNFHAHTQKETAYETPRTLIYEQLNPPPASFLFNVWRNTKSSPFYVHKNAQNSLKLMAGGTEGRVHRNQTVFPHFGNSSSPQISH